MQTLNLSTQCLDNWLTRTRPSDPQLARLMLALARELTKAPKFLLPEGGRPLDDPASVTRLYTELRLPFPCVALEYLADGPLGEGEVKSRKRISLVWSLDQGSPAFLKDLLGVSFGPRRGFLVQSISYIDNFDTWAPIMGMVEVDLSGAPAKMRPEELSGRLLELTHHRMRSQGPTETYSAFVIPTVDRFVEQYGQMAGDLISADSADEVLAALSFAALTMCGNVSSEVIPAPAALNRKRQAKHKPPIFDTRVLLVAEGGGYRAGAAAAGSGLGSHASPRTHLRRGHIRRLADDRHTWVNAAVVNAHRPAGPVVPAAPVPRYAVQRERQSA